MNQLNEEDIPIFVMCRGRKLPVVNWDDDHEFPEYVGINAAGEWYYAIGGHHEWLEPHEWVRLEDKEW